MKIYKILIHASLSILASAKVYASESAAAPGQQLPHSSAVTPKEYAEVVQQRDILANILVKTIECCKDLKAGWQLANLGLRQSPLIISEMVKLIPDQEFLSLAINLSQVAKENVQKAASELAEAEKQLAHARDHSEPTSAKEMRVFLLGTALIKHQKAEVIFDADMEARKALIYKELFGQPGGA